MLLNVICGLIFAIGVAVAVQVVWQYKKETGKTGLDRLWATARDSATYLWGKFCFVLAAISLNLDKLADALGQQQWEDTLNKIGANPKTIGAVLLGVSLVTIAARLRTL